MLKSRRQLIPCALSVANAATGFSLPGREHVKQAPQVWTACYCAQEAQCADVSCWARQEVHASPQRVDRVDTANWPVPTAKHLLRLALVSPRARPGILMLCTTVKVRLAGCLLCDQEKLF